MPGEGDDERCVERADVDPELERVRRHDRAQLAGDQARLDLAALRRGVAGPVGHHQLAQLAGADPLELVAGDPAEQLDALARAHEADRPRAGGDQRSQQLGALAECRAA